MLVPSEASPIDSASAAVTPNRLVDAPDFACVTAFASHSDVRMRAACHFKLTLGQAFNEIFCRFV